MLLNDLTKLFVNANREIISWILLQKIEVNVVEGRINLLINFNKSQ